MLEVLSRIVVIIGIIAIVLLGEHFILKYVYRKRSSIDRLFINVSASAKTDWLWANVYYVLFSFPTINTIAKFITVPGLTYAGLVWLQYRFQWSGILVLQEPEGYAGYIFRAGIVLLWFVLFDFSRYISHILLHKIPWLWRFHSFHHAATELTILTGIRQTIAEKFFHKSVIFVVALIPLTLLGVPKPEFFVFVIVVHMVFDLLQHSDLPWDYGIFGPLITSPRFHRMHHSKDPQDYDSNYGDLFSCWDYLFGTTSSRYRNATSIADTCQLGLPTERETQRLNEWKTSLIHETIFQYGWSTIRNTYNLYWGPSKNVRSG